MNHSALNRIEPSLPADYSNVVQEGPKPQNVLVRDALGKPKVDREITTEDTSEDASEAVILGAVIGGVIGGCL